MTWNIATGVGSSSLHPKPPNIKKDLIVSALGQGYTVDDAITYSLDHGYTERVDKYIKYCTNELPETFVIGGLTTKIYDNVESKLSVFNGIIKYVDELIAIKTKGISILNTKVSEIDIAITKSINKNLPYTALTTEKNTILADIAYEQKIINDFDSFRVSKELTIINATPIAESIAKTSGNVEGKKLIYATLGLYNSNTGELYNSVRGLITHSPISSVYTVNKGNPSWVLASEIYTSITFADGTSFSDQVMLGVLTGNPSTIINHHVPNSVYHANDLIFADRNANEYVTRLNIALNIDYTPTVEVVPPYHETDFYRPLYGRAVSVEFSIPTRPNEVFYSIIPTGVTSLLAVEGQTSFNVLPTLMIKNDKTQLKTTDVKYPKYEKALKYLGVDLKELLKGITDTPNSQDMADIFILFGVNITSDSQEVRRYVVKLLGGMRYNIPAKDYDPNNLPSISNALALTDNLYLNNSTSLSGSFFNLSYVSFDFKSLSVTFNCKYIYETILNRTGILNNVDIIKVSTTTLRYIYQFSKTQAVSLEIYLPVLIYENEWIGKHKSGSYSNHLYPAKSLSTLNIIPLDRYILKSISKYDQDQVLFNSLRINIFSVKLTYIADWMKLIGAIILIVVLVLSYFIPPLKAILPVLVIGFFISQIITIIVDAIFSGIVNGIVKGTINVAIAAVMTVLSLGSNAGQLIAAVLNLASAIISLTATIMKLGFYDLIQKTEDILNLITTEQNKLDEQTSNLLSSKYRAVQGVDLLMNPNVPLDKYYNDKVTANKIDDFLPKYNFIDLALQLPPTSKI